MASVLLRNHDGGMIRQASREDFPAILKHQLLAFGEVAERLGLSSIPPLEQTLEHLREEARNSVFFKYTENSRIVGSVRGCLDGKNVCHVGKLVVDPARRNRGIGQQLMLAFCSLRQILLKPCICTSNWAIRNCTGKRSEG